MQDLGIWEAVSQQDGGKKDKKTAMCNTGSLI